MVNEGGNVPVVSKVLLLERPEAEANECAVVVLAREVVLGEEEKLTVAGETEDGSSTEAEAFDVDEATRMPAESTLIGVSNGVVEEDDRSWRQPPAWSKGGDIGALATK